LICNIAAAIDTPRITIYGASSGKDWAPPGKHHRAILPDRDCIPSRQKGCSESGQSLCLEELSSEQCKDVIRETIDIYYKNPAPFY